MSPRASANIARMTVTIREITLLEATRLTRLIEPLDKEAGRQMPLHLDMGLYQFFQDETPSFALVAERDGVPVGFCSVFISEHQHTSRPAAFNDAIYVVPELRGTGIGARLVKVAETKAKERGCTRFQWAVPKGGALDRAFARRPKYHIGVQTLYEEEL